MYPNRVNNQHNSINFINVQHYVHIYTVCIKMFYIRIIKSFIYNKMLMDYFWKI